jgi:hypothetical protein
MLKHHKSAKHNQTNPNKQAKDRSISPQKGNEKKENPKETICFCPYPSKHASISARFLMHHKAISIS